MGFQVRNNDAHHRVHVGTVVGYKPKRDRRVNVKMVPCPQCKVGIGECCLKADGTPGMNYHRRRRGAAIQAGF